MNSSVKFFGISALALGTVIGVEAAQGSEQHVTHAPALNMEQLEIAIIDSETCSETERERFKGLSFFSQYLNGDSEYIRLKPGVDPKMVRDLILHPNANDTKIFQSMDVSPNRFFRVVFANSYIAKVQEDTGLTLDQLKVRVLRSIMPEPEDVTPDL